MGNITKEERIIRQLSSGTFQKQTAIASEMFLPNHSGDHSHGLVLSAPTKDTDITNKAYVDGLISGLSTVYLKLNQSTPQTLSASPYFNNLTSGRVIFSGANKEINDDGSFLWDNTNKRLGVKTISPELPLHVRGPYGLPATSGTDQTNGKIRISSVGSVGCLDIGSGTVAQGGWIQATRSDNLGAVYPLLLNPNGGSVGIGTTSPSSSFVLNVNGDMRISDTAAYIYIDANSPSGGGGGVIYRSQATNKWAWNYLQSNGAHYLYDYTNSRIVFRFIDGNLEISPLKDIYITTDNKKLFFGTGKDASITYDGTNMLINPQEVGAGNLIIPGGKVGIGTTSPTAVLHLKAGTSTASTAPLKFTSGTLLGTSEAGAIEFLSDDFFATITTGAARKGIILDDGSRLTSGKIPVATTNGRLIDLTAQDTETDLKVDYTSGDLDTEAEIITAINTTNAKINSIIAKLKTLGLLAT